MSDAGDSGQSQGPLSSGHRVWAPPTVEELGRLLPQYQIEILLGHGGMGAVYRGRQEALDRPVAIKVLPETLVAGDDHHQYVERFKLEARAMANLDHPAIISVYDFGQTGAGHLYFVMEYIDGMDIEQYIRASGGSVDPEHAVAIVSHVLDALDYAHAQGIVHRDIKPANVLINQQGRVKIADFGLAKVFGGGADDWHGEASALTGLTLTDMAMGTPDYIAPEALEEGVVPDHRADLYAVGVMLYKMLTGSLPRGIFELPSEANPAIDPRFDELVSQAMAAKPERRYQSASEFRGKLGEMLSRPIEKVEPGQAPEQAAPAVGRSRLNIPAAGARSLPRPPARKAAAGPVVGGGRSSVGKIFAVMAAVTAVVAGMVYLLVFRGQQDGSAGDDGEVVAGRDDSAQASTSGLKGLPNEVVDDGVAVGVDDRSTPTGAFTNSLGMRFAQVPIRGGPSEGQPILFSIWETRVQDYRSFAEDTDRDWRLPNFEQTDRHPAVNLSWDDAMAFCQWLTEREREAGLIASDAEYRLPSDHEWSCLAGIGEEEDPAQSPLAKSRTATEGGRYPWGALEEPPRDYANFRGSVLDAFERTAPVGSFAPGPSGCFDVWGNAAEWCADWLDAEKQVTRVLRGFGWDNWGPIRTREYRAPYSRKALNGGISEAVGFRCVLDAGSSSPGGEDDWIDLLAGLDPERDVSTWDWIKPDRNRWELNGGELVYPTGFGPAEIQFPGSEGLEDFQLKLRFTREQGSNGFDLKIPAPAGGAATSIVFAATVYNATIMLGRPMERRGGLKIADYAISTGAEEELLLTFRRSGPTPGIVVASAAGVIAEWQGDYRTELTTIPDWTAPRIGLWVYGNRGAQQWRFHELSLRRLAKRSSSTDPQSADRVSGRLRAWASDPESPAIDLSRAEGIDDFVQVHTWQTGWVALRANGETVSSDGRGEMSDIVRIGPGSGEDGRFTLIDHQGELHLVAEGGEPAPQPLAGVVDAFVASSHCLVQFEDGTAFVWGRKYDEEGPDGWEMPASESLRDVRKIFGSGALAGVIHKDGSMSVWGSRRRVPPPPAMREGVFDAACGVRLVTLVKRDGRRLFWDTINGVEEDWGDELAGPAKAVATTGRGFLWRLEGGRTELSDSAGYADLHRSLRSVRAEAPGQVSAASMTTPKSLHVVWIEPMGDEGNAAGDAESAGPAADHPTSHRVDGLIADGQWHDVLERLKGEVDEDMFSRRRWWQEGDDLLVRSRDNSLRGFRTEPIESLDARIEFTVESDKIDAVSMFLPSPTGAFSAFVWETPGMKLGIQDRPDDPRSFTPLPHRITGGGRHQMMVSVRPGEVSISLDGDEQLKYRPDDWGLLHQNYPYRVGFPILGLRTHMGTVRFHSYEVRIPAQQVSGSGSGL